MIQVNFHAFQKDVSTWLKNIGLEQYKADFEREQIKTSEQMEVLKSFGRREIEKELEITKKGKKKNGRKYSNNTCIVFGKI